MNNPPETLVFMARPTSYEPEAFVAKLRRVLKEHRDHTTWFEMDGPFIQVHARKDG